MPSYEEQLKTGLTDLFDSLPADTRDGIQYTVVSEERFHADWMRPGPAIAWLGTLILGVITLAYFLWKRWEEKRLVNAEIERIPEMLMPNGERQETNGDSEHKGESATCMNKSVGKYMVGKSGKQQGYLPKEFNEEGRNRYRQVAANTDYIGSTILTGWKIQALLITLFGWCAGYSYTCAEKDPTLIQPIVVDDMNKLLWLDNGILGWNDCTEEMVQDWERYDEDDELLKELGEQNAKAIRLQVNVDGENSVHPKPNPYAKYRDEFWCISTDLKKSLDTSFTETDIADKVYDGETKIYRTVTADEQLAVVKKLNALKDEEKYEKHIFRDPTTENDKAPKLPLKEDLEKYITDNKDALKSGEKKLIFGRAFKYAYPTGDTWFQMFALWTVYTIAQLIIIFGVLSPQNVRNRLELMVKDRAAGANGSETTVGLGNATEVVIFKETKPRGATEFSAGKCVTRCPVQFTKDKTTGREIRYIVFQTTRLVYDAKTGIFVEPQVAFYDSLAAELVSENTPQNTQPRALDFDGVVRGVTEDFSPKDRAVKQLFYGDNVTAMEFPGFGKIFLDIFFSPSTIVALQLTTMFFFTGQTNFVIVTLLLFVLANLTEAHGIYKENCKADALFRNSASHITVDTVMQSEKYSESRAYELRPLTVDHLLPGDVFEVKANQKVPCDCVIIEGCASVNESNLTGEAVPIQKFAAEGTTSFDCIKKSGKKYVLYAGSSVIESKRGVPAGAGTSERVKELLGGEITSFSASKTVTTQDSEAPALALVIYTSGATRKGGLIREMTAAQDQKFKFEDQRWQHVLLCMVLSVGLAVQALIPILKGGRFHLEWPYMTCVVISNILRIMSPYGLIATRRAVANAAGRLKDGVHGITTQAYTKIFYASKVKVQCFDKTGTLTEESLDFFGLRPVQIFTDVISDSEARSVEFGKMERPRSCSSVGSEASSQLHVANVSEDASQSVDLLNIAASTCHTVQIEKKTGELLGNTLEVEMFKFAQKELNVQMKAVDGVGTVFHKSHPEIPDEDALEDAFYTAVRHFEFDQSIQLQSVLVDVSLAKVGQTVVDAIDNFVGGSPGAAGPNERLLFSKGSCGKVAGRCKPETLPANYNEYTTQLAKEGYYTIAMACKSVGSDKEAQDAALVESRETLERDLTFLGLMYFRNELKSDTKAAIEELHGAAITTLMITGDTAWCGFAIAQKAGIIDAKRSDVFYIGGRADGELEYDLLAGPSKKMQDARRRSKVENVDDSDDCKKDSVQAEETESLLQAADRRERGNTAEQMVQQFVHRTHKSGRADYPLDEYLHCNVDAKVGLPVFVMNQSALNILKRREDAEKKADAKKAGKKAVLSFDGIFGGKISGTRSMLQAIFPRVRVFGSMTPLGKIDVVEHWQTAFHDGQLAVGMCGDGGNDSGALKAAHLGVALCNTSEEERLAAKKKREAGKGFLSKLSSIFCCAEKAKKDDDESAQEVNEVALLSPFSADTTSISAVVEIIREGRGALANAVAVFKFFVIFGLTLGLIKNWAREVWSWPADPIFWCGDWIFAPLMSTLLVSTLPSMGKLVARTPTSSLVGTVWRNGTWLFDVLLLGGSFLCLAYFVVLKKFMVDPVGDHVDVYKVFEVGTESPALQGLFDTNMKIARDSGQEMSLQERLAGQHQVLSRFENDWAKVPTGEATVDIEGRRTMANEQSATAQATVLSALLMLMYCVMAITYSLGGKFRVGVYRNWKLLGFIGTWIFAVILPWIYLPMSWVATFFRMNGDNRAMNNHYELGPGKIGVAPFLSVRNHHSFKWKENWGAAMWFHQPDSEQVVSNYVKLIEKLEKREVEASEEAKKITADEATKVVEKKMKAMGLKPKNEVEKLQKDSTGNLKYLEELQKKYDGVAGTGGWGSQLSAEKSDSYTEDLNEAIYAGAKKPARHEERGYIFQTGKVLTETQVKAEEASMAEEKRKLTKQLEKCQTQYKAVDEDGTLKPSVDLYPNLEARRFALAEHYKTEIEKIPEFSKDSVVLVAQEEKEGESETLGAAACALQVELEFKKAEESESDEAKKLETQIDREQTAEHICQEMCAATWEDALVTTVVTDEKTSKKKLDGNPKPAENHFRCHYAVVKQTLESTEAGAGAGVKSLSAAAKSTAQCLLLPRRAEKPVKGKQDQTAVLATGPDHLFFVERDQVLDEMHTASKTPEKKAAKAARKEIGTSALIQLKDFVVAESVQFDKEFVSKVFYLNRHNVLGWEPVTNQLKHRFIAGKVNAKKLTYIYTLPMCGLIGLIIGLKWLANALDTRRRALV